MFTRHSSILIAMTFMSIFAILYNTELFSTSSASSIYSMPLEDAKAKEATLMRPEGPKPKTTIDDLAAPSPSLHPLIYFDQVFSVDKAPPYDFPTLQQQCRRTKWREDDIFLDCTGIVAGLTTIMSQVKVCLKMALDAGTGLILPSMPLRDSTNLKEFNLLNGDAYLPYDKWFDEQHLTEQFGRVCPQMRIIKQDQLDSAIRPVKFRWTMDFKTAPRFREFESYFWTGRPFRPFFEKQLADLQLKAFLDPERDDSKMGITVITIETEFLLYRLTDDPTGHDVRLWNDLSHLIRFGEEPRRIVNQLLSSISRPFYGVHFRVEADTLGTIWSGVDNQLKVDLDALDEAWAKYGTTGAQKPLVYLACGDQEQVGKFVAAGSARGWEVTHKWQLAGLNEETLKMINDLAFDFQGAIDMGIMVRSEFFLGIIGSAFSCTVANARDVTGRYRGSSFVVYDDENARNHLFNDGDSDRYACCL